MSNALTHSSAVDHLGDFAAAVNADYGVERSLKVAPQGLLGGRALITFHRSNLLAAGGWPTVAALLVKCGLERQYHPPLAAAFENAELVHFGLQEAPQLSAQEPWLIPNSQAKLVIKIYFETATVDNNDPQWSLKEWHSAGIMPHYLAYKWHPSQAPVVTHYGSCPALVEDAIADSRRVFSELLNRQINQLLGACERSLATSEGQLLTVLEPATMRRSIDFNLYSAERVIGQVKPFLMAAMKSISPTNSEALEQWLEHNNNAQLGHLAWGCGRKNEPFLTCYYGVREVAAGVSFLD